VTVGEVRIEGYRSIRSLRLPLGPGVTVIVGANGSGKTNIYRSLRLLSAAAEGTLARFFEEDGGLPSMLWAGVRRNHARARITCAVDFDDLSYELTCGPIPEPGSPFELDPDVKRETAWAITGFKRHIVAHRAAGSAHVLDADGNRAAFPFQLWGGESMLAQISEPNRFSLLSALRDRLLRWRFYHHFRSDPAAPARQPQVGVRTPALAHDGRDLSAALRTVHEIGDRAALHRSVDRAFPGTRLELLAEHGRFTFRLDVPGLLRPLDAAELSDGTLRYLCLLAGLLSPRTPPLLTLNEPETSLHSELLPALAELIADAGERGQILVTTHSDRLAKSLEARTGAPALHLSKERGATVLALSHEPTNRA
jgi:predicted ATPase